VAARHARCSDGLNQIREDDKVPNVLPPLTPHRTRLQSARRASEQSCLKCGIATIDLELENIISSRARLIVNQNARAKNNQATPLADA
jgi:hypothetical protein